MQWCTDFFCVFSLFLFCRPSVDSILKDHIREQMSKGLRNNTATEDMEGDRSPSVSEHDAGMLSMFRVLMAEQRKSDLAREEARILEAERKEEAKRREDDKKEEARVER